MKRTYNTERTPTGGRFRGTTRLRMPKPRRPTRVRSELCLHIARMKEFGPGARFLRGRAGEGGHYRQPVIMYRARRFKAWHRRLDGLRPILRFEWR